MNKTRYITQLVSNFVFNDHSTKVHLVSGKSSLKKLFDSGVSLANYQVSTTINVRHKDFDSEDVDGKFYGFLLPQDSLSHHRLSILKGKLKTMKPGESYSIVTQPGITSVVDMMELADTISNLLPESVDVSVDEDCLSSIFFIDSGNL